MKENFEINPAKYKSIADHRLNYFADVVEIIALVAKSEISVGETLDRFYDCGLKEKKGPETNDSNQKWVETIFDLIEFRSVMFGEKYPFKYDNKDKYLIIKESQATCQKLYIQLLISANLPFFSSYQTKLTTDFENVSYYSLQGYLSKGVFKQFGKNSDYTGNAEAKIRALANDIRLSCRDAELEGISKYNSNEKGLDIVAWLPFGDDWGNLVVVLGQCACENDNWFRKQHDTRRYNNYFRFKCLNPIHALFIPHSLTKQEEFYESAEIQDGTLLFERRRILENFKDENFPNIQSITIVDELLSYREGVV